TVVALCDIDGAANHLGRAAEKFPRARRLTDWRRLLDRAKEFDALTVSTPDHMHAPIALPVDHYVTWADACRGVGKAASHFDYAGGLTEAVLLGTVAIRVPGQALRWDAARLRVAGAPAAEALLRKAYRKGWEPAWVA